MKKVFLSTPFAGKVDPATGEVTADFRRAIEGVLDALRKTTDVEVFSVLEDDNWRIVDVPAEVDVKFDLEQLDAADVLLVLTAETVSPTAQFEMGYAVAKNKQVILASLVGAKTGYFNQGVASNGMMTLVTYDNLSTLIKQLDVALHAPEENV